MVCRISAAAGTVYETIRRDGTQQAVVETMQSCAERYDVLGCRAYEDKLDALSQEQSLMPRDKDGN